MKIIKKLSPIMESISNVGKNKKKMLDEEFDVNHPIGVLPHADAVAMEQHIADRAAGLERRANPDKDPLVKELIDETASEKSRTLHYDVVDRKGLAKILTEAKKNNQKFKVGKSDKAGYRYFVDIMPIYGSKGALEVDDGDTEVDEEALTESLLKEDIEKELKEYIKWCEENNKEAKDAKSLEAYLNQKKSLKEDKYKTPVNDSEDYINAMYKAYKALSKRKTGYAAVYGYSKNKKFTPLLSIKDSQDELNKVVNSLKTREKGATDVTVYTLFKNKLDDVETLLKEKGLLKESLKLEEDYNDFDYYVEQLEELDLDETDFDYYLEKLYEIADEDEYASYKSFAAVLRDARATAEDESNMMDDEDENLEETLTKDKLEKIRKKLKFGNDIVWPTEEEKKAKKDNILKLRDKLNEDLQLYASSLKDFKPAKEAEELWNEIIEKGKLDDLEYELENVFKADDDKNASIDIEGLNDLLVNHQDFIRTLIGLDEAPLEDDDYNEEPVGGNEMVYYEDDEEPVDEDASIEDGEDDIDTDEIEGIDEDEEDDIEPVYGDEEERKTPIKWKKIESDEDDDSEEYESEEKEDKSETEENKEEKKEEKVEESLKEELSDIVTYDNSDEFLKKYGLDSYFWFDGCDLVDNKTYETTVIHFGRNGSSEKYLLNEIKKYYPKIFKKLKLDKYLEESLDKKEPEIKIDDEEDLDEGCEKDLKECGSSKDDDLTENIAKGFVKNNFTEAKDMSNMSDEEKRQELARKSLASLNESDEEVVEIDDKELTEALGMPTEDQVKKEEPKVEQPKPEESKPEEPKEEEDKKGE